MTVIGSSPWPYQPHVIGKVCSTDHEVPSPVGPKVQLGGFRLILEYNCHGITF